MKEFRVALVIGLLLSVGAYTVYAASAKISADATVTPASGDYIPIVQAGVNKKSTAAGLVTYITSTGTFQPKEATLTDIADGTIAENLVNTANPWADNEVADTLTVGASGAVDNDALDDDLKAVGELATTGGTAVRTAPNTWALRTITGTSNEITVTNGNGISGPPTIELPDAVTISGLFTAGTLSAGATSFGVDADGDVTGKSFSTPQSEVNSDSILLRGPGTNGRGVRLYGPAAEPAANWSMQLGSEPSVNQLAYIASTTGHALQFGFTYPTVNGVIDTIAWEGYREAHDDLRYIATLEHYIDHGACSSSSTVRANAATAKAYLDDLKATILTNMTAGSQLYPGYLVGGDDSGLDTMRSTITDYIETLPEPKQITSGSFSGVRQ